MFVKIVNTFIKMKYYTIQFMALAMQIFGRKVKIIIFTRNVIKKKRKKEKYINNTAANAR